MEGSETDSKALMVTIVWQKGKTTTKIDIFVHQYYFLFIMGSVHAWETKVCLFISISLRTEQWFYLVLDVKDKIP